MRSCLAGKINHPKALVGAWRVMSWGSDSSRREGKRLCLDNGYLSKVHNPEVIVVSYHLPFVDCHALRSCRRKPSVSCVEVSKCMGAAMTEQTLAPTTNV